VAGLVSLAEVKAHPVRMFLVQLLHQIERALAQGLANRVEEHKDQVRKVTCNTRQNMRLRTIEKQFRMN
jgi:hypothetical protein